MLNSLNLFKVKLKFHIKLLYECTFSLSSDQTLFNKQDIYKNK